MSFLRDRNNTAGSCSLYGSSRTQCMYLTVCIFVTTVGGRSVAPSMKKEKAQAISVNDRVSLFLELADAHRQLDQQVQLLIL